MSDPFPPLVEHFGDDARRVLAYAIEEGRGLHHNYIGTEHLLLLQRQFTQHEQAPFGVGGFGAGVAALGIGEPVP
jgi:ClpA/ClpB-like protein